jgi:fatty acid desaturase
MPGLESLMIQDRSMRPQPLGSDYEQLAQLVRRRGLLKRRPAAGLIRMSLYLCLLGLGLRWLASAPPAAEVLAAAAALAFVCTQLSFLVHDAGHHQFFAVAWKNDLAGYVHANLLLGMSYSWWRDNHNRHHRYPNQVSLDPDISIPVLAFFEDQAAGKKSLARWIVKRQALLFFPLTLLEAISKRRGTVLYLLQGRARHARIETLLIAVHYAVYFGLTFHWLPSTRAFLFIAVHQALYGLYMAAVFAPNHKGMPILLAGSPPDPLRLQILTARNVKPHPLTDFLFGGLNYQIEHHLFPAVPSGRLREAREIIQPFCTARSIRYYETGALQSYQEILRHLHKVSRCLRAGVLAR